jgi:hypothetical protein
VRCGGGELGASETRGRRCCYVARAAVANAPRAIPSPQPGDPRGRVRCAGGCGDESGARCATRADSSSRGAPRARRPGRGASAVRRRCGGGPRRETRAYGEPAPNSARARPTRVAAPRAAVDTSRADTVSAGGARSAVHASLARPGKSLPSPGKRAGAGCSEDGFDALEKDTGPKAKRPPSSEGTGENRPSSD